jgi:thiamine-phosphate pyrophosphorylase
LPFGKYSISDKLSVRFRKALNRLAVPQKMPFDLQRPLIYLITSGQTTAHTTPGTEDFATILKLIRAAVVARIDLVQIREKNLSASVLYQLSASAVGITQDGSTKLLINDRSDIASAVAADGVHLTTSSLPTDVVRRTFGAEFLIGVSTHSVEEVSRARQGGADFVVFGPVFDTASKKQYGDALGLIRLARVSSVLSPFPVLAIGGITIENVAECIRAGARGIAAIGMLQQPDRLPDVADEIRRIVGKVQSDDVAS